MAAKVGAHAMAGGVMNELQGGKFGHGFASAGMTQALAPAIDSFGGEGFSPTRVAIAALVGGTTSAATGGKFANGAATAAFSQAFNGESHRNRTSEQMSPGVDWNWMYPESEEFLNIQNYLYPDGFFVIAAHGNASFIEDQSRGTTVRFDNRGNLRADSALTIYAEDLAKRLLTKGSGYTRGMPIVLATCNAGRGPGSTVAQDLANLLGVEVRAPNGYTFIGKSRGVELPIYQARWPSHIPKKYWPDRLQPGSFQSFYPDQGKKR